MTQRRSARLRFEASCTLQRTRRGSATAARERHDGAEASLERVEILQALAAEIGRLQFALVVRVLELSRREWREHDAVAQPPRQLQIEAGVDEDFVVGRGA